MRKPLFPPPLHFLFKKNYELGESQWGELRYVSHMSRLYARLHALVIGLRFIGRAPMLGEC